MKNNKLTQRRLKDVLMYNSGTGVFTWRNKRGTAGHIQKNGYVDISVDKVSYYAHRLAFLYMNGYFPENFVDHIDRNPNNNAWYNLREASQQCNIRNASIQSNNKTGVKGVYFCNTFKKFVAKIAISRKTKHLGYHVDFKDAVYARWKAEIRYEWDNCCSDSSAYNYLKKNGHIISEWERP